MKRWLSRIVILLILGAVTTVAVAWGLALAYPNPGPETPSRLQVLLWFDGERASSVFLYHTSTGLDLFFLQQPSTRTAYEARYQQLRSNDDLEEAQGLPAWSLGALVRRGGTAPEQYLGTTHQGIVEAARGWPSRVLFSRYAIDLAPSRGARGCIVLAGMQTGRVANPGSLYPVPLLLPVHPIWRGFLLDTLFYAAIWFGLFFGFASARRALRRRRGRCPKCGYDLRGLFDGGCSECGWNRREEETERQRDGETK